MKEQVKARWGETLTREQAIDILQSHGFGLVEYNDFLMDNCSDTLVDSTDALFDWLGY